MQEIKQIEIGFDNGESIVMEMSQLENFVMENITRSLYKVANGNATTYLLAEEVLVLIKKEANQPSAFTEDFDNGQNTPFQRLLSGGIASIDIRYETLSETVFVPCKQEPYGRNEYEAISELENGNLLIVIKPH